MEGVEEMDMWERDGVSGREMEYVGVKWFEWKEIGICLSKKV